MTKDRPNIFDYDPRFGAIILWETLKISNSRSWRLQSWMLDFARPGETHNPIRIAVGYVGCQIQDHLSNKARKRAQDLYTQERA